MRTHVLLRCQKRHEINIPPSYRKRSAISCAAAQKQGPPSPALFFAGNKSPWIFFHLTDIRLERFTLRFQKIRSIGKLEFNLSIRGAAQRVAVFHAGFRLDNFDDIRRKQR